MQFMSGLNNAVQQSVLTRLLANIVATFTILAAVFVLVWEALHGEALNPWFIGVAAIGLGQYSNIMGVNQGVTLQPLTTKAPTSTGATAKSTPCPPNEGSVTSTTTQTLTVPQ